MKIHNRLLAAFLAAAILLCCIPGAMAYGASSNWAKPELDRMEALGLIPDSLLEMRSLTGPMTREQLCDLVVTVYETYMDTTVQPENPRPFPDTTSETVAKAYALGVVSGYNSGKFHPADPVTREMYCTIVYRLLEAMGTHLSGSSLDTEYFMDKDEISSWSKAAIRALVRYKILQGSGGKLRIKDNISCEQGLVLLCRVYEGLSAGTLYDRERYAGMASWAKSEVTAMDKEGLLPNVVLYDNLSATITRKELCYVAVQTFYSMYPVTYTPNPISPFKDISDPVVTAAYQLGLIQGYGDQTFHPNEPMTREDLFCVIGRFLMIASYYRIDAPDANVGKFSDWGRVSGYAQSATRLLIDMGIVKGNADGTLNPKGTTDRQSALLVFYRSYRALQDWKAAAASRPDADLLINLALQYVGYPYTWGGTSPTTGFDCSGFVYYLYRQIGYTGIPRTADYQYLYGTPVSPEELLPGDLIIFSEDGTWDGISHVAIYLGNSQYIHAANSTRGVVIDDMPNYYYNRTFYGCCRIIP